MKKITIPCSTPGCTNLIPGRTNRYPVNRCFDCKRKRRNERTRSKRVPGTRVAYLNRRLDEIREELGKFKNKEPYQY